MPTGNLSATLENAVLDGKFGETIQAGLEYPLGQVALGQIQAVQGYVPPTPSFVGLPYIIYASPLGPNRSLNVEVKDFVTLELTWTVTNQSGCGYATFLYPTTSGAAVFTNTIVFAPYDVWNLPNELIISVSDGVTTITTVVSVKLEIQIFFPIRWLPMDNYELFLTDQLFRNKGVISYYTSAQFVTRFNDIGTFSIEMGAEDAGQIGWSVTEGASPYHYIALYRNGNPIFLGIITEIQRTLDADQDKITINGTDVMKLLQDRVALPLYNRSGDVDPVHDTGYVPDYSAVLYDIQPAPTISSVTMVGGVTQQLSSVVGAGATVGTGQRTYRIWISTVGSATDPKKPDKFSWARYENSVITASSPSETDIILATEQIPGETPQCAVQAIDGGAVGIKFSTQVHSSGAGGRDTEYWTFTYQENLAPVETIIKNYVRRNIGVDVPVALDYRKIDNLLVDTDTAYGANTKGRARFDNLLELIQKLAVYDKSQEVRFYFEKRTDGAADGLIFKTAPVTDKTATIVLSKELGTIRSFDYSVASATGNYVYVGGKGSDGARLIYELITNEDGSVSKYGLIEKFIDSSGGETITDLYATGIVELAKSQDNTKVEIIPSSIPNMTIIDDYWVGDKVSAIVDDSEFQEVIREITLELTPDGVTVTPVIGTPEQRHESVLNLYNKTRNIDRRINSFERR